jgi:predicted nicotinamide N-methyase
MPRSRLEAEVDRPALIRQHTIVAAAPLVPELPMHVITEASPLWRASEADAAELGLPLPYWAFIWPGGQVLARLVLDRPELVRGKRVLDFGSGCAIEAIAALKVGASQALAADIDPFAQDAALLNAKVNDVALATTTDDLVGARGDWDVILAGDVMYDRDMATRALTWLRSEAARGVDVLLGDPNRGWLDPRGLERVASFMAAADGDLSGVALKEAVVWRVRAL